MIDALNRYIAWFLDVMAHIGKLALTVVVVLSVILITMYFLARGRATTRLEADFPRLEREFGELRKEVSDLRMRLTAHEAMYDARILQNESQIFDLYDRLEKKGARPGPILIPPWQRETFIRIENRLKQLEYWRLEQQKVPQ